MDLETTGLDPRTDEVLSVGVVHIDDGAILASSAFYSLVRPMTMPPATTIVVHGIRPADLHDAEPPEEVAPRLRNALAGREVVAHVAAIEEAFLSRWLGTTSVPPAFIDTDSLMRLHVARTRDVLVDGHVGLGPASEWFGLPEHQRHHALGDALTTAQLFLALATVLTPGGATVADLHKAPRDLARQRRRLRRSQVLDRVRGRTRVPTPTNPEHQEDT